MSRTRVWKPETVGIMQRFFATLDELKALKRLRGGVAGYCQDADIDRRHLYAQKKDASRGFFEVAWLLPLMTEYNVEPQWLLFGTGEKYKV